MSLIGLLAGYFTLFLGGIGIVFLLLKDSHRMNAIECVCVSWVLGVGLISLCLWIGGMFVSGLFLQTIAALACLALAIVGWRTKQKSRTPVSLPRLNGAAEWVLTSMLLVELVVIFVVSLKHTLGWDGLLNWEIKARYAFLNSGVLPQPYYANADRAFSHPEYPLAIPFTELWLYICMGAPHQFWIKTIFPVFYISGALLIALLISRLTGRRWIGLLVALLIPFLPFILTSPGGVTVGYVDVPLSFFYAAALGYLLCALRFQSKQALLIYAALLTLLPWIKSEGIILWAILVVLSLGVGLVQGRVRLFFVTALPGLLLVFGWQLYLRAMRCVPPADFARPSFQLLSANIGRVPEIFRIVVIEITDIGLWSCFWLLALAAIIYLLAARRFINLILAMGIVGPVAVYSLTYLFSAWPSYTAHITSSFPRLLLQVVPAGWLAIGLAISRPKPEPNLEANVG